MRQVLFEELKLPGGGKKGKAGGLSTDSEVPHAHTAHRADQQPQHTIHEYTRVTCTVWSRVLRLGQAWASPLHRGQLGPGLEAASAHQGTSPWPLAPP